jgi:hypothetical protein
MVYCSNSMGVVITSRWKHIICKPCCFPMACEFFWRAGSKWYYSFLGAWFWIFVILKMQTQLSIHGDLHSNFFHICCDQILVKRSQNVPVLSVMLSNCSCVCCMQAAMSLAMLLNSQYCRCKVVSPSCRGCRQWPPPSCPTEREARGIAPSKD